MDLPKKGLFWKKRCWQECRTESTLDGEGLKKVIQLWVIALGLPLAILIHLSNQTHQIKGIKSLASEPGSPCP